MKKIKSIILISGNGSNLNNIIKNVNSGYIALGYSPIIEITEVNPNQIFYNDTPDTTNQPGNTGNITVTSGPAGLTSIPATPPSPASADPGLAPGPAQLLS